MTTKGKGHKRVSNMERMLIVDGNNYINRGYHAVKGLSTKAGVPTNAVKGMLAIIIADLHTLRPDYVVVTFDSKVGKNWRQIAYPAYKKSAAREKSRAKAIAEGSTLPQQFEPVQNILKAMGILVTSIPGQEADDVVGTVAKKAAAAGIEVIIASMDKDFAQLVEKYIKMMKPDRIVGGPRLVQSHFGVKPEQIIDYLALLGDSIDNIPGVTKVGPTTAAKLLNEHGNLRSIVQAADSFTPALSKNVKEARKQFKWTKPLLKIKTDVELDFELEDCRLKTPKYNRLKRLCRELELTATHKEILRVMTRIHGEREE